MTNWEPGRLTEREARILRSAYRADRLTRKAQIGLVFIVVSCGTVGLLILMYQGF